MLVQTNKHFYLLEMIYETHNKKSENLYLTAHLNPHFNISKNDLIFSFVYDIFLFHAEFRVSAALQTPKIQTFQKDIAIMKYSSNGSGPPPSSPLYFNILFHNRDIFSKLCCRIPFIRIASTNIKFMQNIPGFTLAKDREEQLK